MFLIQYYYTYLYNVCNNQSQSVNDVLLGITTAGLTRYLRRRYRDDNQNLPSNIRLRSVVLVNQRKAPEIHVSSRHLKHLAESFSDIKNDIAIFRLNK